jgi:hypothetical protein
LNISSSSNGILEITFPRELYDAMSLTEHGEDPVAALDGILDFEPIGVVSSCEQTTLTIPVKIGTKEIELVYSDILMEHIHSYPQNVDLLKTIEIENHTFAYRLITDAKKCDVYLINEEKKIRIDIEGRDDIEGLVQGTFRITIPHDLLGGNYTVLVDGSPVEYMEDVFSIPNNMEIYVEGTLDENTGHRASHILFGYPTDAAKIEIIGTKVLPEYSYLPTVAAVGIASVLVIFSRWKRLNK